MKVRRTDKRTDLGSQNGTAETYGNPMGTGKLSDVVLQNRRLEYITNTRKFAGVSPEGLVSSRAKTLVRKHTPKMALIGHKYEGL